MSWLGSSMRRNRPPAPPKNGSAARGGARPSKRERKPARGANFDPVSDLYLGLIGTPQFSPKTAKNRLGAPTLKHEILTKLKTAEDENARRIEQAKEKAAEILKKARSRADEIRRQALEEAQRDQARQLEEERKRLAHERETTLADGKKREEKLRAQYRQGVEAQAKKAVDVFSRSIDA